MFVYGRLCGVICSGGSPSGTFLILKLDISSLCQWFAYLDKGHHYSTCLCNYVDMSERTALGRKTETPTRPVNTSAPNPYTRAAQSNSALRCTLNPKPYMDPCIRLARSLLSNFWHLHTCQRQTLQPKTPTRRPPERVPKTADPGHIWPSFIFSAMGFLSFALSCLASRSTFKPEP